MNHLSDISFFIRLTQSASLAGTAQELGLTPSAVSRRLAALERRLGVRLLKRTTRSLALTAEGERYLAGARRIEEDLAELEREVTGQRSTPQGLLRVNASFGFGRRHLAPAIAAFVRLHPQVEVQLQLTDRPPSLADAAFDVSIRFGEPPDARLFARKLLENRRVLCAAPAYLAGRPLPVVPRDLSAHDCIVIRENDNAWGKWKLHDGNRYETMRVKGPLATNDGETAVRWALAGHGIVLRSLWDIAPYLQSGELQRLLPGWQSEPADIYALYPERMQLSAKVGAFVGFLETYLAECGRDAVAAEGFRSSGLSLA